MSDAPASVASLVAAWMNGRPAPHSLWLRFGDCRLRLDSGSPELVAALGEYYEDFAAPPGPVDIQIQALEGEAPALDLPLTIKEPDPGKSKIKEEYLDLADGRLVRKRLTGMVFLFGSRQHLALGPCLVNDNQVVNFINSRYIQWLLDRDHLLCHAAGVARESAGLALAGFSGMGKSTLALRLVSGGLDFVSNDRLLIRRQGDGLGMHGVAKLPRINPGTALTNPDLISVLTDEDREHYSHIPSEMLWSLERKYDVYLDRCFGDGRFRIASTVRALVILNWRERSGGCRLSPVDLDSRPDLLGAVVKSPGLFFLQPQGQPADASPQTYLRALAGCPAFELTGAPDFARASRLCLEILDRPPETPLP